MAMLIVLLIIIGLVTIFSVQNAAPVTISFLFWNFQGSLAIVILLSTVVGVVIGVAALSLIRLKSSMSKKDGGGPPPTPLG